MIRINSGIPRPSPRPRPSGMVLSPSPLFVSEVWLTSGKSVAVVDAVADAAMDVMEDWSEVNDSETSELVVAGRLPSEDNEATNTTLSFRKTPGESVDVQLQPVVP
jgi:hypothetical protein